jgi:hypothetical protein
VDCNRRGEGEGTQLTASRTGYAPTLWKSLMASSEHRIDQLEALKRRN